MSFSKSFPLILAGVSLVSCGRREKAAEPVKVEAPLAVKLSTVQAVAWPDYFEAPGTVRARQTATVSARVMGPVDQVTAREGDRVAAGQLLAKIDARDLEIGVRQAEAALAEARSARPEAESAISAAAAQRDLAQATHRRMKDLFEKRSISSQEMDEANAKLRQAEAAAKMAEGRLAQLGEKIRQAEQALESARVRLGWVEVKAPFAGRVVERKVEPGNLASPGLPLFLLEQEGVYRLEASIDESRLAAVRLGQSVRVDLDAVGGPLEGRVAEIVPVVDAASRSFIAKIELSGRAGLRSGLYGRARFPAGAREVLSVPAGAVAEQGQLQSVYVADGGYARNRLITVGARRENLVEVLSGLQAGEHVIDPRPAGLRDGSRVEVRQ